MRKGLSAFCSFFAVTKYYDVGVKRSFAPYDTGLFRTACSHNPKNIHNPLIFLWKMAAYSCFWRIPRSKILLQASLHRISDLLTLVSYYFIKKNRTIKSCSKSCRRPESNRYGYHYPRDFKSRASASSATTAYSFLYISIAENRTHTCKHCCSWQICKWAKVDSNHRRQCQQIYSLSPLATREFAHGFFKQ